MEYNPSSLSDFANITQLVATKAMQAASKRSNFVCSPYALTLSLLTLFPYLDMNGKKQVASLLGIKKQIQNFQAFLGLPAHIDQRGTGVYLAANRVWAPPAPPPDSIPGRMISAGVEKHLGPLNSRSNFYVISDEIEGWYRQKMGEMYPAIGPILGEGDIKTPPPPFLATSVSGFYGGWENKFHNNLIGKSDFKTNFGQVLLTPFMQRGAIFRSDINPQCKTLEMIVESKSFSHKLGMVLLSPRYVSLKDFEARLSPDFFQWAVSRIIEVESIFTMPLFTIQSTKTLPQLFGDKVRLDALDEKDGASGKLLHKTGIVVNDYGVGISENTMPLNTERIEAVLPPAIFFCDSPFTFWLRDRDSGVILLAGHYATPFPNPF